MAVNPDVVERLHLVVSLAQGELAAQVAQEAGIDTKAAGIAGLAWALVVGIVAGSSVLGRLWWISAIGFALTAVFAVAALFTDPLKTGPRIADFYQGIQRVSAEAAMRQAVEDLRDDIRDNGDLLDLKRALLQRTMGLFLATFVISTGVLLAFRR